MKINHEYELTADQRGCTRICLVGARHAVPGIVAAGLDPASYSYLRHSEFGVPNPERVLESNGVRYPIFPHDGRPQGAQLQDRAPGTHAEACAYQVPFPKSAIGNRQFPMTGDHLSTGSRSMTRVAASIPGTARGIRPPDPRSQNPQSAICHRQFPPRINADAPRSDVAARRPYYSSQAMLNAK